MDCSIRSFLCPPRVCSNLGPLCQWCYLTIWSSAFSLLAAGFFSIWLLYWSFSISLSNEYSGLITCNIVWFDLAGQGTLHLVCSTTVWRHQPFFMVYVNTGKTGFDNVDLFKSLSWPFFFLLGWEFKGGGLSLSCGLFTTPWTVACWAPQPMEFSRQENRLPFPLAVNPGIEPMSLVCLLHWQADSLPLRHLGSTQCWR